MTTILFIAVFILGIACWWQSARYKNLKFEFEIERYNINEAKKAWQWYKDMDVSPTIMRRLARRKVQDEAMTIDTIFMEARNDRFAA